MTFTHSLTEVDGHRSLSVFDTDDLTYTKVLDQGHPYFQQVLLALIEDPQDAETIIGLIDPEIAIRKAVQSVSKRVTVDRNGVYLDGIREQGALATLIKNKVYSGDGDWGRFVRFLVNLSENPSHSAQTAVFAWVEKHGATITEDGRIVGFKGLVMGTNLAGERVPMSQSSGPNNFIDGLLYGDPDKAYQVPHVLGTTVSKRRRDVDNSSAACSTGLHVGAYDYALTFGENRSKAEYSASMGRSTFALVAFSPRDVVNEGTNDLVWKIRVCQYEVIEFLDGSENVLEGKTSYDTGVDPVDALSEDGTDLLEATGYVPRLDDVLAEVDGEGSDEEADLDAVAGTDGAAGPAVSGPYGLVQPEGSTLTDWVDANPGSDLVFDLNDRNLGHKPLARKYEDITSEASVRRFRNAAGIKIALRAKVSR